MYSSLNGRVPRDKPQIYNPMQHFNAHYCTEPLKNEMKFDFENEIFLQNLHLCPDPLKKNLADTVITCEKVTTKKSNLEVPKITSEVNCVPKMPLSQSTERITEARQDSTLAGIAGFFSGMMNVLTNAMFRTKPAAHYHDCCDAGSRRGSAWHPANTDDQDKIGTTPDSSSDGAMNNCKAITSCEEKLNKVKYLLSSKPTNPTRLRKRPKKVFVEPGSVEDSFEDAFSPEDFVSLSNEPHLECYSPPQHQYEGLLETRAAKTKVEVAHIETTDIVNDMTVGVTMDEVDSVIENKSAKLTSNKLNSENVANCEINSEKDPTSSERMDNVNCIESSSNSEVVSTCEDKLSKLKALLQEKRKKNSNFISPPPEPVIDPPKPAKTIPIVKATDKHYKNPCRTLDKRCKTKMRNLIQDDANFANELIETPDNSPSINSSSGSSLGEYFDELKGRFQNPAAVDSDDSFQIVFHEPNRCRNISDCDSEDSFIVFEDSPDCYTNNDVFGESESDSESDSGCSTMKLSHSLSRTVSNLTDDTLFESSDEVDCARVKQDSKSLLLNADKKQLRKDQPAKTVRFSSDPPKVRVMRVWAFAAKQARAGHWERFALDRERFKRRIADVDMAVSWVLKPQHRSRVMFQRFMPWWNQERRKEIAEKKEAQKRIEEEKKVEEEQRREEEQRIDGQTQEVTEAGCSDESKDEMGEVVIKSGVEIKSEVKMEREGNILKGDEKIKNLHDCDESDDFKMASYLKNRNESFNVNRFHAVDNGNNESSEGKS